VDREKYAGSEYKEWGGDICLEVHKAETAKRNVIHGGGGVTREGETEGCQFARGQHKVRGVETRAWEGGKKICPSGSCSRPRQATPKGGGEKQKGRDAGDSNRSPGGKLVTRHFHRLPKTGKGGMIQRHRQTVRGTKSTGRKGKTTRKKRREHFSVRSKGGKVRVIIWCKGTLRCPNKKQKSPRIRVLSE